MAACQTGNILNLSSFASNVGISVQTVKRYLSIMSTSYQCSQLNAYHFNQRKQITKAPKLYFLDTGIVNLIMKNKTPEDIINSGHWGSVLETFVYSQFHKTISNMESPVGIYYWRTNNSAEVDFVIETNDSLIPIEVKGGKRIRKQSIRGLKSFSDSQKNKKVPFSVVLYGGKDLYRINNHTIAVPLTKLIV